MNRNKVPGIEASTGSLGHGISISIGIALASKIKQLSNKVFVIVGDVRSITSIIYTVLLIITSQMIEH